MACDEAIILVGGLGTRLRSVVNDVPKPLAPVANRPFLAWLLDRLEDAGLRRVILASGHMAGRVEHTIGRRWGRLHVDYSVEDQPLGTGGAVTRASRVLTGSGVHVLNGDTYLRYSPQELERLTRSADCLIGVALAWVDDTARYGAITCDGVRIASLSEKGGAGPGLINAGAYFLTADALAALPRETSYSFETGMLAPMVDKGAVLGFSATEGFIDIGVPEDFMRAQDLFP